MLTYNDYSAGHPWRYKLGGKRLSLEAIRESVIQSGYRGYMREDIDKVDRLPEPKRSVKLRELKAKVMQDLASDIARYRQCARELAAHRRLHGQIHEYGCPDIFVSISLKHNHIYNDFAHLVIIDKMLNRQPSLFDFRRTAIRDAGQCLSCIMNCFRLRFSSRDILTPKISLPNPTQTHPFLFCGLWRVRPCLQGLHKRQAALANTPLCTRLFHPQERAATGAVLHTFRDKEIL